MSSFSGLTIFPSTSVTFILSRVISPLSSSTVRPLVATFWVISSFLYTYNFSFNPIILGTSLYIDSKPVCLISNLVFFIASWLLEPSKPFNITSDLPEINIPSSES